MGRWANKYVIGLTGNIAMGKSTVRKMLENLGAYTIDADALVHQATSPGAPAYAPVIEMFGKWIVGADNRIDRAKLGAIAFSHPDAMAALEKLTHPIVSQAIDLLISRAGQPIVVVEAIKLVDGTLGSQVDSVWVVDANADQQVKRLMSRRNLSETDARQRVAAQNTQADKLAQANLVIHNDGSPEDLYAQVQRGWESVQREINKGGVQPSTRPLDPAALNPTPAVPPVTPIATPVAVPDPAIAASTPMPTLQPKALTPAATRSPQEEFGTRILTQAEVTPPAMQPMTPPVTPPVHTPPPAVVQQTAPILPPPDSPIQIEIRRGKPENTEAIARLLTQSSRKHVSSTDVMLAFGERSFFLAESAGRTIGLISFQVENLITRISEVVIVPEAPVQPVMDGLLNAVENAARSLQSEVAFIAVSASTSQMVIQAFLGGGYERISVDSLRIPAWREAASEMQIPGTQVLMHRLRESLVLTPN